ncbi:MAG: hypothetical protein RBQ76_01710 [Sulfurovum sp.]|nr:hypothetical protein [Sulfurovum sp.]
MQFTFLGTSAGKPTREREMSPPWDWSWSRIRNGTFLTAGKAPSISCCAAGSP